MSTTREYSCSAAMTMLYIRSPVLLMEVGGRHRVFGAPKLISQSCCLNWPMLKLCIACRGQDYITWTGLVGQYDMGSFRNVTGIACGHTGDSVQFGV